MIKYLDIILRKLGLVRIELADSIARTRDELVEKKMHSTLTVHKTEIAKLYGTIDELKSFQADILRRNAENAVGMYG